MRKLNLGCGKNWQNYPDYEGLDIGDYGQKWKGDVLLLLVGFGDNSYDEVMANHFLEHFDQDQLRIIFSEVHRILKPEGKFEFIVPHKIKDRAWVLSHKTFWCEETVRFLEEYGEEYGFGKWKIKELVVNGRLDICVCLIKT
uniref:Methyltransferase domain-containing protein n=1 Tax=Caldisericum exile TaxID=693075 RepID=A0A7C4TXY3_9BACT